MSAWLRAGLVAALFVVLATPSEAAKKTFQDDALDDAAITLEADLKDQAGTVDKPLIKLKQQADTLLKAQDLAKAPPTFIRRSSRSRRTTPRPGEGSPIIWLSMPVTDEDDGATRFEQRDHGRLYFLSAIDHRQGRGGGARHARQRVRQARRMAPGAERAEDSRSRSTRRLTCAPPTPHCARITVSASRISAWTPMPPRPRACFQFSESLPKRTDFAPYVAVVGQDKPAHLGRRPAALRRRP